MTLHSAPDPKVSNLASGWLDGLHRIAGVDAQTPFARRANRALVFFIILFSLSVPHSIAAAQISLGLSLIAWIARDSVMRHCHFARLPIDLPLSCFAILTIISSVFSVEPSLSMPKLKGLLLFGVIYLVATNINRRGVSMLAILLIISSLVGVGFSLMEKVLGRGMIIESIEADSPLAKSMLQPGDLIWMIGRKRVFSPEEAADIISRRKIGEILEVEALHAGDPVPVILTVTEELKARENPLGIVAGGTGRRFRISGFSRQFLTYAEQMQILAMLALGGMLTILRLRQNKHLRIWVRLFSLLFAVFALALVLTASRAVIASFIAAVLFVAVSIGGRMAPIIALTAAIALGGVGFFVINSSRQQQTLNLSDDSTGRRIAYMQSGLRVIPKRPLIGVGMDSHKLHWREWGFPGDYITHTHSTPIQIAMDRGIPALGCYFWLITAMGLMARQIYKRSRRSGDLIGEILGLGVFGALIGFFISSVVNYNFGDSEVLMMLLFVFGMASVIEKPRNVKADNA